MTHVIVNIDEPGSNVEVGDVHDLSGLVRGNIFFHCSDLALENADIAYFIDVIRRVDDMAALQQQVVACRLGKHYDGKSEGDCDHGNCGGVRLDPVVHRVFSGFIEVKVYPAGMRLSPFLVESRSGRVVKKIALS
jgi:hypothetical protein